MSIPAGWYPNPDGTPTQRWWDGQAWSAQTSAQVSAPAAQFVTTQQWTPAQQAPAGTSGATVPFWLFGFTPLLSLLTFAVFDIGAYLRVSVATAESATVDPTAQLSDLISTGYLNALGIGLLVYVVTLVLALLDYRVLRQRGVPSPFHWAFAFIPTPLVYLIGRPLITSRRGARGSRGAVIAYIACYVIGTVVSIVIALAAMASVLAELPAS